MSPLARHKWLWSAWQRPFLPRVGRVQGDPSERNGGNRPVHISPSPVRQSETLPAGLTDQIHLAVIVSTANNACRSQETTFNPVRSATGLPAQHLFPLLRLSTPRSHPFSSTPSSPSLSNWHEVSRCLRRLNGAHPLGRRRRRPRHRRRHRVLEVTRKTVPTARRAFDV